MSRKNRWRVLSLCLVLLLWLATGCSKLSPLDNGGANSSASSSSGYPPITEELLQNGPVPGHPILRLEQPPSAMGVENWDYAEAWIEAKKGGEVFTSQGSGCIIPKGALPTKHELITVTLPVEGYAIVDFGPHPLCFKKPVWLVLSLNGTNLGSDPAALSRLVVFYWDENTDTYEEFPCYYDPVRNALMCLTNHFSRYIIAQSG